MTSQSIWTTIIKHLRLMIVSALIFLAVGVALGLTRSPSYTSSIPMVVRIGTSEPAALGGISEVVVSEAGSFSRAIHSNSVVDPVAKELNISPAEVSSQISATPVPESGDLIVRASGESSDAAMRLVAAAASSLARYVSHSSNPNEQPEAILTSYEEAVTEVHSLENQLNEAERAEGSAGAAALRARLQAARLQEGALKTQYQGALLAPTAKLVSLNDPSEADSDRASKTALLGFLGLLFGLVVGGTVAVVIEARAPRRHA